MLYLYMLSLTSFSHFVYFTCAYVNDIVMVDIYMITFIPCLKGNAKCRQASWFSSSISSTYEFAKIKSNILVVVTKRELGNLTQ